MKEHPIIFSTPMVQAIIEGRKTQTRRIIKPQPELKSMGGEPGILYEIFTGNSSALNWSYKGTVYSPWPKCFIDLCAKLEVGDLLWVKETFGFGTRPCHINGWRDGIEYRADEKYIDEVESLPLYDLPESMEFNDSNGWKPSIFMPKAAARIWLEITNIRVEHLQDISEEDAIAEGIEVIRNNDGGDNPWYRMYYNKPGIGAGFPDPIQSFESLWQSINGAESWNINPWVWVIEFKEVENPIS